MIPKATAKIGWVGVGVMGNPLVGFLLKAGYNVSVFDRMPQNAANLVKMGATYYNHPRDLAAKSDVLFTMVGYPKDIENLYFCKDNGIYNHLKEGTYCVDHTTSKPALAIRLNQELSKIGVHSIDAPVSGGDVGARNGALSIMMGGKKEHIDAVQPLMENYGKMFANMGAPGAGQHCKAANQVLIAGTMNGMCESLLYGHKAGLDVKDMVEALKPGAAGSFSLSVLGPRILKRDFDPGFLVEHFVKDLGIVLEESERMGISMPATAVAMDMYKLLMEQGGARLGT